MAKQQLSAAELKLKKMATLAMATFSSKDDYTRLNARMNAIELGSDIAVYENNDPSSLFEEDSSE